MHDQAEELRQRINKIKNIQTDTQDNLNEKEEKGEKVQRKAARVITITSGKGGVGKTNISVNLAIALSELGLKVTILDADLGLANVDLVFGIIPRYTFADVLSGKKNIFDVLETGPRNIKFISGGSGMMEMVNLNETQLEKLVKNISLLDAISDIILIDTGAGLSDSVTSFVMAADEVILVTTPEPTSITDAYALIKMVSARDKGKIIKVIVNKAENAVEAENILRNLTSAAEKFLGMKISPLGYVQSDDAVVKAVKLQQPVYISYPNSYAAKHIMEISKKLANKVDKQKDFRYNGIRGFINKLAGSFGKRV